MSQRHLRVFQPPRQVPTQHLPQKPATTYGNGGYGSNNSGGYGQPYGSNQGGQ